MLNLNVRLTGDEEFTARLRSLAPRVALTLMVKMNALLFQLQSKVIAKLSGEVLHRRTGVLAGSVRAIPAHPLSGSTASNFTIQGAVQAGGGPAFYAAILEEGSKPHEILATKARALRFVSHGKEVYAASVLHPGNRPYRFMASTLDESRADIESELREVVNRVLNGTE